MTLADWTAPDECAFNTLVDVTVDGRLWSSPAFDGPMTPFDTDRDGFLGGVVPTTAPASGEQALLVLVVGFTQGTVLTVEAAAPTDSPYAALDTQPADGWSPLGLLLPAGDEGPVPTDVVVTAQASTGETTETPLTVPVATGDSVAVLTAEWEFDETAVGPQCEPPTDDRDPLNVPTPDPTDPLGGPIREQPDLPPPGPQPADPTGATAAALEAFRTV